VQPISNKTQTTDRKTHARACWDLQITIRVEICAWQMLVLRALFLFPGLFVYYFVFCRWIHCLIE
jgi:hypothetical protein